MSLSRFCLGLAEFLLLSVVTAAPWCIGGVLPQFQMLAPAIVIIAFGCALAGYLLGQTTSADFITARQTWILVAALILAVLQVVPLPHSIGQAISPNASIAHNGTADFTQSPEYLEQASGIALSLIPFKTKLQLGWMIQITTLFALSALIIRRRRQVTRVLSALAINSIAMAGYGIYGVFTKQEMLFGTIPLTDGGHLFGAFVNRNHAVGFMAIGLMASLALCVLLVKRAHKQIKSIKNSSFPNPPSNPPVWSALCSRVGIVLLLAIVTILLAMFTTGSRTAIAAMTVSASCGSAMLYLRGRMRWSAITIIMTCAFGSIIIWALGIQPGWTHELLGSDINTDDRLSHWKTAAFAINDFWLTGTGLGTYADIIPLYEVSRSDSLFLHAENIYIETALESGVIGLSMLGVVACSILACAYRLTLKQDSLSVCLGIATILTLIWHAIHGCFDFAVYLPGVSYPLALLFGTTVGRYVHISSKREKPLSTVKRRRGIQFVLLTVSLITANWWSMETLQNAGVTEILSRDHPSPASRTGDEWQDYIDSLERTRLLQPNNPQTNLSLALVELASFEEEEWDTFLTGYLPDYTSESRSQFYFPRVIHQLTSALAEEDSAKLSELRDRLLDSGRLAKSWDYLLRSRAANPLQPQVHLMLAQLSGLFHPSDSDQSHLDNAIRMVNASYSPSFVYEHVGRAHADAGRTTQACKHFSRFLATTAAGKCKADIVTEFVEFVSIYDLDRVKVCEQEHTSHEIIVEVAFEQGVFADNHESTFRNWFEEWLNDQISSAADSSQKAHLTAISISLGTDTTAMTSEWKSALRHNKEDPLLRSQFARLLYQRGHNDEAIEQIRLCKTAQPQCQLFAALASQMLSQQ